MSEQNQNAVANTQEQQFKTQLSSVMEKHMGVIKRQMMEGGAEFDGYSGKCVMAAMSAINNMIHSQGLSFSDLNQSNITEILLKVATLKLNANAVPRECYFQVRNVNVAAKGQSPVWEKQIEFGIEGDGNDAILARYGRDIKKVHQVWLVREGDKFTYPSFNGLQMTAPTWQPTGQGEVIRVVYPVVKTDGTVEYYIGERRDVLKNLFAHINNNLMNETFGLVTGTKKQNGKDVPRTRFDATDEEKKKIEAKKKEILLKAKKLNDLDKILDSEEFAPYISPAWTEFQSREQMIIRKMRNNVARKIPKDFGSAIAAEQYNLMDDTYREVHAEIEENANNVVFESEYKEVEKPEKIEDKQKPKTDNPSSEKVGNKPAETPQPKPVKEPKTEPDSEPQQEEPAVADPDDVDFPMPDWMQ